MVTVSCPKCQRQINLDPDLEIGQQVICQLCAAELEVVWLFPICLDEMEIGADVLASPDGSLG